MELFEEIRRGYAAGETIKGLAKKHGVHRRMVRQAIASAIPPERKKQRTGAAEARAGERVRSSGCWKPDREAPRKQRHTAHRIWTRLSEEHPEHPVGEADRAAICAAQRKRELGLNGREVFVPQSYELGPGSAGRLVRGGGETGRRAAQAAVLRDAEHGVGRRVSSGLHATPRNKRFWKRTSMASPISAACSAPCATTTWHRGEEDSARTAADGNRTDHRVPLALGISRASTATRPAATRKAAWKGNWAGSGATVWCRFRKRRSGKLNEQLLAACVANRQPHDHRQKHDGGRGQQHGAAALAAAGRRGFPIDEIALSADRGRQGRVKVKTNWYSAPLWPGMRVTARVWPIADRDRA